MKLCMRKQMYGCFLSSSGFMLCCFRGNIWCSGCNHHCCIDLCFPVYLCDPVMLQVCMCLVSYFAVYIALDVCSKQNGKLK